MSRPRKLLTGCALALEEIGLEWFMAQKCGLTEREAEAVECLVAKGYTNAADFLKLESKTLGAVIDKNPEGFVHFFSYCRSRSATVRGFLSNLVIGDDLVPTALLDEKDLLERMAPAGIRANAGSLRRQMARLARQEARLVAEAGSAVAPIVEQLTGLKPSEFQNGAPTLTDKVRRRLLRQLKFKIAKCLEKDLKGLSAQIARRALPRP